MLRAAHSAVERLLPALLMASSVSLLTFGLLSYGAPPIDGRATGGGAGDPIEMGPPAASREPTPTVSSLAPSTPLAVPPTPAPSAPSAPSASGPVASPTALGLSPGPTRSTGPPSAPPSPSPTSAAVATRIVIPSEGIDLPVISSDVRVPGQGPDGYPVCDVAMYLSYYGQPGEPGTVYIYAHAREGMFLPLLEASLRREGASLLGALVEVYTADHRLHLYEIDLVKRHATDFTLADDLDPGEHRLVIQTSEGPRGTLPKLQVAARPLSVVPVDGDEARPRPRPRPCYEE